MTITRQLLGGATLAACMLAEPTSAGAFEVEVGKAYVCPNGISLVVKELSGNRLVTVGPGEGSTTEWTGESDGNTRVYREEGFLAFFQIVIVPGDEGFSFATPDGLVKGCRETGRVETSE